MHHQIYPFQTLLFALLREINQNSVERPAVQIPVLLQCLPHCLVPSQEKILVILPDVSELRYSQLLQLSLHLTNIVLTVLIHTVLAYLAEHIRRMKILPVAHLCLPHELTKNWAKDLLKTSLWGIYHLMTPIMIREEFHRKGIRIIHFHSKSVIDELIVHNAALFGMVQLKMQDQQEKVVNFPWASQTIESLILGRLIVLDEDNFGQSTDMVFPFLIGLHKREDTSEQGFVHNPIDFLLCIVIH